MSGAGAAARHRAEEREADAKAVARVLGGDVEAFGELVERWQDRVHGIVFRMVRDRELTLDLAQETFLKAYRNLASFRGGSSFGTWVYAIAVNQVRSEMRKRSAKKYGSPRSLDALRTGPDGEAAGIDPPADEPGPPERLEADEARSLLLRELDRLQPDQREVVVLREFRGMAYEEIAEVLEIPVGTVRSRLFRARSELRERLAPVLGPEMR